MSNSALHMPHILTVRYRGGLKMRIMDRDQRTCWGSRDHENKGFCILGKACKNRYRCLSVQTPQFQIEST
jgi:hypothetical protein